MGMGGLIISAISNDDDDNDDDNADADVSP
jgi:hypothetical protein